MKADDWRSAINETESSWYLKHQNDYGSWQWIKTRVLFYAICNFVARGIDIYMDIFTDWTTTPTLVDDALYWSCYFIWWFLCYFMPLPILYFILRNISILDDGIGLKKEMKVITYLLAVINIITLIRGMYPVIFSIDRNLLIYLGITDSLYLFIDRLLFIPLIYMQTRWVVRRFGGFMLRHSTGANHSHPMSISLSTTKMRYAANDTTLNLIDDGNNSLTPVSEEMRTEMKRILMKYTVFEAFVRFLLEVCFFWKQNDSTRFQVMFCLNTGILPRFLALHHRNGSI